MYVTIKLNGTFIASVYMTASEIRNAQNVGFTILRKEAKHE